MAREFNPKANRTNLHLSAQCRKQIAEIREAAAEAGELKPIVAAIIGEAVAMLYAQRVAVTKKGK